MMIDKMENTVLTVKDLERTCWFYACVLDMDVATLDGGRKALMFDSQRICLEVRQVSAATPNSANTANLCFTTCTALSDVITHLHECGVPLAEPPAQHQITGSRAAVYFRDPDENLIELVSCQQ